MVNSRKMGIVAALLLFLVTVGAAVFVVKWYVWPEGSDQSDSSAAQNQVGEVGGAGGNQIQVGVLLSYFSATGPHRQSAPYGYQTQIRAAKELHDGSIHLIPVIEPDTARNTQLQRVLSQYFPGATPLDAGKVQDLQKLDVLVAMSAANVPDNVLSAIDQSVRQGMGLLQRQLGYLTPGYTPRVNALCGFADGTFGWNAGPVECEVVGNHPLLGSLAGKIGTTISLTPNGTVGMLKGIPLLRVKMMSQIFLVNADHPVGTGEYLYPLYISQLGRGRIVGIGFTQGREVPEELEAAHHGRFYIHCVQWLAGKPLD
jgi:hypothetical protein